MTKQQIAPPPAREDTYDNVNVRQVRVTDKRTLRTKKDVVQFNTKVEPSLPDLIDAERRYLAAEADKNVTRGEFLMLMYAAWMEMREKGDFLDTLANVKNETPSTQSKAHGRTKMLKVFVTPELSTHIEEKQKALGWTVDDIIEDHAVKAAKYVRLDKEGKI